MSSRNNTAYSQSLYLLALKGQITVEFMDGNTVMGEFAAQDTLNIFITIDNTPLLIPRSQIRFIKGSPAQTIEEDNSFAAQPAASIIAEPEPTQDSPDLDDTLNITADTDVDESEQTMVLPDKELAAITETAATESPPDLFGPDSTDETQPEIDNDEDFTMVIQPEEVEEEEATFVLSEANVAVNTGADTQEAKAYLDCITGPHAGEVFKLMPGITSIGRSTDNVLPLPKDKEISRRHTKITYEGGQFVAEDQGSLNGTFVNNQRIDGPRYLEEGDVLMVGVSTLIYHKQ